MGEVTVCLGCGSKESMEELRKIPGVISCCPERKTIPLAQIASLQSKLDRAVEALENVNSAANDYIIRYLLDELETPETVGIDAEQHESLAKLNSANDEARAFLATLKEQQ